MELRQRWCDNTTCRDYGKVGAGNIKVFSHVERRYYCVTCRCTFSADKHTFFVVRAVEKCGGWRADSAAPNL
jgi:hypothetical protein